MPLLKSYPHWTDYFCDKGFFEIDGDNVENANKVSKYISRYYESGLDFEKEALSEYKKQIQIKYPECIV